MNRVNVLGVSFDNVTMDEAIARAMSLLHEGKQGYVVTPNPEIVMNARENPELMQAVSRIPAKTGSIFNLFASLEVRTGLPTFFVLPK